MHPDRARICSTAAKRLAQGLLAATLLAALAGCASGGSSPRVPAASASQSFSHELDREIQLRPLLVACFAQHGLIPARDLDSRWYQNGHVTMNNYWVEWWHDFEGLPVKVNGTWMHLDDVARRAATSGFWPVKLCGTLPSASPAGP
jgi:hypothetical protein